MGRQGKECNQAIEEALFDIEVMIEANDIEGLQGKYIFSVLSGNFPDLSFVFQNHLGCAHLLMAN